MKTQKLKKTRSAEAQKIDLAIKYQNQGKATGGGWVNPKRIRRSIEARNIPVAREMAGGRKG